MTIEIKSPTFPESVADGTVANWLKKEGENVEQDEVIAEIETDKVVLEVVAPTNGVLTKIVKNEGDIVNSSEVIGVFIESSEADDVKTEDDISPPDEVAKEEAKVVTTQKITTKSNKLGPAAKKMISEGHEVYGVIHDKPSQIEGIQIINADLTKNDFVIPNVKFDIVFHLAAATPLVKDKKKQKRINYEGTVNLFEKIKDKKELEKIILCDVQIDIYPDLEKSLLDLLHNSGYPGIKIEKKIDFKNLYNQRFN